MPHTLALPQTLLTILSALFCHHTPAAEYDILAAPSLLAAAVAISSLTLSSSDGVMTPELLLGLSPLLHILQLCVQSGLDDDGMSALLAGLPHLRSVTIIDCPLITSISLAMLSQVPSLRDVTLKSCGGITAGGVAALAARISLDRLTVSGCPGVPIQKMRSIMRILGRPQLVINYDEC